jgi:hypothetical protein
MSRITLLFGFFEIKILKQNDIIIAYVQLIQNYRIGTVAAVEISDKKDLNTLYKYRNLISVNRIFIKDYKVSVSI